MKPEPNNNPMQQLAMAMAPMSQAQLNPQGENRLTLLMSSADLDRAFLGFMLANGARSMGMEVNIFFALWGLNLLRRQKDQPGMEDEGDPQKRSVMTKMMGMMMPCGPNEAGLSKMNFGGMGAKMMKHFMNESGAASLPELMDIAIESGVEFTVCSLTMDIMGFTPKDLLALPNAEFGGIASCLGSAMKSKMFLVI